MGRAQTYDSAQVIQAARDLFWDKGFEGASLAELEKATGLNRSSLYHAFGSKRGLFDSAVTDYLDTVIRPRLRLLTGDEPGRTALLGYFGSLRRSVATLPEGSPRRGCLLVNCAAGLAGYDDSARAVVEAYRVELGEALRAALDRAATDSGRSVEGTREATAERVRTLVSLSTNAMLVSRINREEAVALLDTAMDHIADWFPPVQDD